VFEQRLSRLAAWRMDATRSERGDRKRSPPASDHDPCPRIESDRERPLRAVHGMQAAEHRRRGLGLGRGASTADGSEYNRREQRSCGGRHRRAAARSPTEGSTSTGTGPASAPLHGSSATRGEKYSQIARAAASVGSATNTPGKP
jgi:hypothetical protein